jgi:hypothetical protein
VHFTSDIHKLFFGHLLIDMLMITPNFIHLYQPNRNPFGHDDKSRDNKIRQVTIQKQGEKRGNNKVASLPRTRYLISFQRWYKLAQKIAVLFVGTRTHLSSSTLRDDRQPFHQVNQSATHTFSSLQHEPHLPKVADPLQTTSQGQAS